ASQRDMPQLPGMWEGCGTKKYRVEKQRTEKQLFSRPLFFCLVTDRYSGYREPPAYARRDMARRFAVSVRRASEAPQKSLLQNQSPTVRPRDSWNHRGGSDAVRLSDKIGAQASDGDDRRSSHPDFVQRGQNLSNYALPIF